MISLKIGQSLRMLFFFIALMMIFFGIIGMNFFSFDFYLGFGLIAWGVILLLISIFIVLYSVFEL